jgi:uncharacterized repeat protein (TIGR03803 family)
VTLATTASAAPKYKVLHAFSGGAGGGGLWGSLLPDQQGNLYGTTSGGGAYGQGTVFELTPGSHGRWTETVLHSFPSFPNDGQGPTSSLILDTTGDLFGTTLGGGDHDSGVAFELAHDSWAESILYNFCAEPKCSDGGSPYAGLVGDNAGNLYGTAGAVFELLPASDGWEEVVLHNFTCHGDDGCDPYAGTILDAVGNLYGTTEHGGTSRLCGGGCGTAYEVEPTSASWEEDILHDFGTGNDDMAFPGVGALALDSLGNLYGTAGGGESRAGVVFRLTRGPDGIWKTPSSMPSGGAQTEADLARAWSSTKPAIFRAPPSPGEIRSAAVAWSTSSRAEPKASGPIPSCIPSWAATVPSPTPTSSLTARAISTAPPSPAAQAATASPSNSHSNLPS